MLAISSIPAHIIVWSQHSTIQYSTVQHSTPPTALRPVCTVYLSCVYIAAEVVHWYLLTAAALAAILHLHTTRCCSYTHHHPLHVPTLLTTLIHVSFRSMTENSLWWLHRKARRRIKCSVTTSAISIINHDAVTNPEWSNCWLTPATNPGKMASESPGRCRGPQSVGDHLCSCDTNQCLSNATFPPSASSPPAAIPRHASRTVILLFIIAW